MDLSAPQILPGDLLGIEPQGAVGSRLRLGVSRVTALGAVAGCHLVHLGLALGEELILVRGE
ncbi:MAG TPA: hypothetical protein VM283_07910, partial [Armatimonadota bacterium]|nr:hypothetical protein [Armatimonadota bacterium]